MGPATSAASATLEHQIKDIVATKRRLQIKMQHLERIKSLTKNEIERRDIDRRLFEMRMTFLEYAHLKF
ncbi:hypothetical protein SlsnVgp024 [Spodoptera littoralis nucleopolyhedrovirus]|uniref:Uncharacterized protein n=1 Tax=Spodoptera littoralis nuclear polyhedrosis virus TaxID=10456 RepID=M1J444_NPVSL|nr:hypothetical protein SlsnVgp024 [Spodoptera littoralis nucleopolyhedrovirus]AGE89879.1 hypothetical protein SlsnVgp024 [Spodoptera littoralis nucleopolyhedrovirus]AYU75217.1 hypothetical protein [Spodoptera littoralis nucleopolyhedrovirus]